MPAAQNLRTKFNRDRGKQVLRYPLKMFAEGTDYLQIDMVDYVPVATRGQVSVKEYVPDPNFVGPPGPDTPKVLKDTTDTVEGYTSYTKDPKSGFRRNGSKQPLGTILLPIPSNIQDGNSVDYTDDSMNTLVGAALGGTEGLMKDLGSVAGTDLFNVNAYGNVIKEQLSGAIEASGLTLENAQNLATKYFTAQALNIFGANVSLNQLLARQSGQIFNPNMELLFNSPSLRNFTFSFKMTPRSADESEEIKSIIRFFKRGMAPKANGNGLFLKTPNVFELRYRQGNNEHSFLHRFKQCFLTNISVNYTGDGVYSTYNDGTPVSMVMTLMFKELAPIYDIDYDDYTTGEGDARRDFKSPVGVGY